jgi:hypothetical protein
VVQHDPVVIEAYLGNGRKGKRKNEHAEN